MKTTFILNAQSILDAESAISIIGGKGQKVRLAVSDSGDCIIGYIEDNRDLERLAVNILKAIGSKKLQPNFRVKKKQKRMKI